MAFKRKDIRVILEDESLSVEERTARLVGLHMETVDALNDQIASLKEDADKLKDTQTELSILKAAGISESLIDLVTAASGELIDSIELDEKQTAKANITGTAQFSTITAREVDFVTRFTRNWDALTQILGIMRPIRKTAGTRLVSYEAEMDGTLAGGTVAEGDEIPFTKFKVKEVTYGDDIDNCPKNTKELKKLDSWEAKMSGTFVTVTAELTNHQGRASKRMQRRHAADKRKERRLKPLLFSAKRYTRIELASQPWEGRILPLN